MLPLKATTQFKRDYKLTKGKGYDLSLLKSVLDALANHEALGDEYYDHSLSGNYSGFRECHLLPHWVLIYKINKEQLLLVSSKTGLRTDLFHK